jgi:hypothetical protein
VTLEFVVGMRMASNRAFWWFPINKTAPFSGIFSLPYTEIFFKVKKRPILT